MFKFGAVGSNNRENSSNESCLAIECVDDTKTSELDSPEAMRWRTVQIFNDGRMGFIPGNQGSFRAATAQNSPMMCSSN
jgi:hypothetical protein